MLFAAGFGSQNVAYYKAVRFSRGTKLNQDSSTQFIYETNVR